MMQSPSYQKSRLWRIRRLDASLPTCALEVAILAADVGILRGMKFLAEQEPLD